MFYFLIFFFFSCSKVDFIYIHFEFITKTISESILMVSVVEVDYCSFNIMGKNVRTWSGIILCQKINNSCNSFNFQCLGQFSEVWLLAKGLDVLLIGFRFSISLGWHLPAKVTFFGRRFLIFSFPFSFLQKFWRFFRQEDNLSAYYWLSLLNLSACSLWFLSIVFALNEILLFWKYSFWIH